MNAVKAELQFPGGRRVQVVAGDITDERVDAIVNAANAHLQHGGGVAGAISRKGGPEIQQQSDEWVRLHGPVKHEHPAWTSAGVLHARYIIHAVGPVWGAGDEDRKLAAAVSGALGAADDLGATSIALPAISTGIFGFPTVRAADIIVASIATYLGRRPASGVREVRVVLIDAPSVQSFVRALARISPSES